MCCFTGPVQWVGSTKIFARPLRNGRQLLVYSMSLDAKEELAMVLPIPVPKGFNDQSVQFINLEHYPEFFTDMMKGFPRPASAPATGGFSRASAAAPPLEVHSVGSFEASFVPKLADFSRLDKRFRLPEGAFERLPEYKDFGFAVFKLKSGKHQVHPMAFTFPRANLQQIFFPTVHIHDGQFHATADFDHLLYFQLADADYSPKRDWLESSGPAGMFMKVQKLAGLIDPELHCYERPIVGRQKNADIWK